MTDREALAAALEFFDGAAEFSLAPHFVTTLVAARERLAQLPEKCEHGETDRHVVESPNAVVVGATALVCPGKVYPAELVERLAEVIGKARGMENAAVAVLDALNGNTE